MKNLNYLFAANLVIWVVFFFYQFSLSRRNAHLEKEIELIQSKLKTEESARP